MRPSHANCFKLTPLCALLVLTGWSSAALAQNPVNPPAPLRVNISEQLLSLDISINGAPHGRWSLLERNGMFYAPQEAFIAWQVKRRPNAESLEFRGQNYFPLASVPGFEARINFVQQAAALRFAGLPEAPATATAVPKHIEASSSAAASIASPPYAATPTGSPPPTLEPSASGDKLLPLEVSINSAASGSWTLLERNGVLYAPEEAFDEWRLNRRPEVQSIQVRGRNWFPLTAIAGFAARLNFANQSVDLVFAPSAFSATKLIAQAQERPALSPVLPAVFVNYDLSFNASANRGSNGARELGALTEFGVSNNLGVLTSSYAARNIGTGDPALQANVRRLETTFTRDFPDSNLTLRLGDANTRSATLGRSVFFGGIQLGRNFALSPGFISQPIPVIRGTSNAPSTVELYINDALRQTSSVPTGPFAIDNFPLLTGSGQARVVVRDLLGRETVLVQPFFTSTELLEEGLSDWSTEVGAVRRNLGTRNADYGEGFLSGALRYGLSKDLTVEGRAEISRDVRGGSIGASYALPFAILGQVALGLSDSSTNGRGVEYVLGLEKTGLRHGFTARAEGASRDYRQLGLDDGTLPQKLQLSASYSYATEDFGALGLGLARIESFDRSAINSISANYSFRIGQRSSLTVSATKVSGSNSGSSVGLSFVMPLDSQLSFASSFTTRGGQNEGFSSVSKGLASETGVGWRALAGTRQNAPYSEAGAYFQGNQSLLSADISASKNQQNLRLGAQGGLVFTDGQLFASRRVQDSFALVEVPGYPNVGVGFQGSDLTRTNADGVALLPRLLPYQTNSIRLNPNELPINAEIDDIEQIVIPAGRSGVKVTFPVRSGRAALIKLVLDDGEPAPAGAELELAGDKKEFFVARRGEAFITGLQNKNTLKLKWNGASCAVSITLDDIKSDDIARIGPLTCSGVKR